MSTTDSIAERLFDDVIETGPFPIRFPAKRSSLDQDEERCEVRIDDRWQRVRFHDYASVYKIPGLYETLFYRTLRCNSPAQVAELLGAVLLEQGEPPEALSVVDLGAGNGIMGEALHALGTRRVVGIDLIAEAEMAAARDRPWVYNDYVVTDMTAPPPAVQRRLEAAEFNAMTSVAALGFGDIPPEAFFNTYNLVADGGWLAFNIKEGFLKDADATGFSGLIHRMTRRACMQIEMYKRYCHRLNVAGEPLHYIAVVARKLGPIPRSLLEE